MRAIAGRIEIQAGLTLLTALHDMATLTIHCDAGILLSEGRVTRLLPLAILRQGAHDFAKFEAEIIQGLRQARY